MISQPLSLEIISNLNVENNDPLLNLLRPVWMVRRSPDSAVIVEVGGSNQRTDPKFLEVASITPNQNIGVRRAENVHGPLRVSTGGDTLDCSVIAEDLKSVRHNYFSFSNQMNLLIDGHV